MRAILSGDTPAPPISRLTGLRLAEVGPGSATFTMPLSRWLLGPQDTVTLGALTMPADGAMGCAILTELPAQTPITTAELSLRLLHAPGPGGTVHAVGRVVHTAAPLVLAEVEVRDDSDQLLAHGSSLYMTMPGTSYRPPAPSPTPRTEPDGPDPWQRELADHDRPPIELLTGLAPVTAGDGRAVFTLPASPWLCAPPPGRVQGGMVATLAEAAMEAALQTRAPAATRYAPVDLKMNYLRPLASDGRPARAEAHAVHSGRRLAVAHASVTDADGRAIAAATGSGLFTAVT